MAFQSLRDRIAAWARRRSPWILHFNSGACNACDIETVASLTPVFDVERLGVQLKGSPRHADVLVCTGPVTHQMRDRLIRIYQQMPEPKLVVAVGTCACSGGVFRGCYCVEGGVDAVVPVAAYVPGCAARPEAIIDGLVKLLATLDGGQAAGAARAAGQRREVDGPAVARDGAAADGPGPEAAHG